jgi:hypothetical protein
VNCSTRLDCSDPAVQLPGVTAVTPTAPRPQPGVLTNAYVSPKVFPSGSVQPGSSADAGMANGAPRLAGPSAAGAQPVQTGGRLGGP